MMQGRLRSLLVWLQPSNYSASEILPGQLLLGNIADAFAKDELQRRGVTHIVTAVLGVSAQYPGELPRVHTVEQKPACWLCVWFVDDSPASACADQFEYLNIPVIDNCEQNLTPYLDEAVAFIRRALAEGGRVLVHCMAGRSRSASLVIAYLMTELHLDLDQALAFVQEKRPIVRPNAAFMQQLRQFHARRVQG